MKFPQNFPQSYKTPTLWNQESTAKHSPDLHGVGLRSTRHLRRWQKKIKSTALVQKYRVVGWTILLFVQKNQFTQVRTKYESEEQSTSQEDFHKLRPAASKFELGFLKWKLINHEHSTTSQRTEQAKAVKNGRLKKQWRRGVQNWAAGVLAPSALWRSHGKHRDPNSYSSGNSCSQNKYTKAMMHWCLEGNRILMEHAMSRSRQPTFPRPVWTDYNRFLGVPLW